MIARLSLVVLVVLASTSLPFLPRAAHAATFASTQLQALAEHADVIVRVRVTASKARWLDDAGPSRIVTFHEVRLLEVVSGRLNDDEAKAGRLLVGVPGGVVGDVEQRVPGAPALERGRDYLLLLGRGEGPGGARGIAGLEHGVVAAGPTLVPYERSRLDEALPLLRARGSAP